MSYPSNKTKIVCTLGPASDSPEVLEKIIKAGMNVARLNFSHGNFSSHAAMVQKIRRVSGSVGRRVAIMADLPGPKMRIGQLELEPVQLNKGGFFTLTTKDIIGDEHHASVTFPLLTKSVKPGDKLFLNDGIIQLTVNEVSSDKVKCKVLVGGELRSRKGLNLPGIELGISAFTENDKKWLKFAAEQEIDAISQSFVESAADINAVRDSAAEMGYHPFIIAKIERSQALDNIDGIIAAADGIMIARGDLGVEIPIEKIALVQKQVIRRANIVGKPVITATQMLESMIGNQRPTRAEATDVANAILDGTDCVMLSGESAMGKYPVDAVSMLSNIASSIEPYRPVVIADNSISDTKQAESKQLSDLIATSVASVIKSITPETIIVPTHRGSTARSIARFRSGIWISAVSSLESTCQNLLFSYGVYPIFERSHPEDWRSYAENLLKFQGLPNGLVILTEGPSAGCPLRNNSMEILDLRK